MVCTVHDPLRLSSSGITEINSLVFLNTVVCFKPGSHPKWADPPGRGRTFRSHIDRCGNLSVRSQQWNMDPVDWGTISGLRSSLWMQTTSAPYQSPTQHWCVHEPCWHWSWLATGPRDPCTETSTRASRHTPHHHTRQTDVLLSQWWARWVQQDHFPWTLRSHACVLQMVQSSVQLDHLGL